MRHGSLRGRIYCLVPGDEFLRSRDLLGRNCLGGSTVVRSDKRGFSDRWGNDVMGDSRLRRPKTRGGDERRVCDNHGRDDGVSGEARLRRSKNRGRSDKRRHGNHRRDDVIGDHRLGGFKNGGRNDKRMGFADSGCEKGSNGWNCLGFFKNRRRNGERGLMNCGGDVEFLAHECLGWFNNRRSDYRRVDGHERGNAGVVLDEFDGLGRRKDLPG